MCVFLTKFTAVLLNPFFTFLSFSKNISQVAAILVCYSPVDGEIGSKQFAMSQTPIMVLNNCWKWALFWSETFSLQSEMFIAHYNFKKKCFSVWQMNLINDLFFHGNNMLFYQKQCKKVLRVHKTLLFNRNSCFHLLNLLQGGIRSVLFTLFKSLYIIHLWGLLGLTTTFLIIGSETFGFSSEMFAPQKVLDQ